jgi:hypothetical protein
LSGFDPKIMRRQQLKQTVAANLCGFERAPHAVAAQSDESDSSIAFPGRPEAP